MGRVLAALKWLRHDSLLKRSTFFETCGVRSSKTTSWPSIFNGASGETPLMTLTSAAPSPVDGSIITTLFFASRVTGTNETRRMLLAVE